MVFFLFCVQGRRRDGFKEFFLVYNKKQKKGAQEPFFVHPLENEDQAAFKCRVIVMIHETDWTPFIVACLRIVWTCKWDEEDQEKKACFEHTTDTLTDGVVRASVL